MIRRFALSAFAAALLFSSAAFAALPVFMAEKDVLPFLERMISWRRDADTLETSPELPRDQIFKAELRKHMQKALDDGFGLARALADSLPPAAAQAPAETEAKREGAATESNIHTAIARSESRVQGLIQRLRAERAGRTRALLDGQLKLEQQRADLLRAIAKTIGVAGEEDASLQTKIAQLQETVAEAGDAQKAPDAAPAASAPSSSILGLSTRAFGLLRSKGAVGGLLGDTKALYADNRKRAQGIRDALRGVMDKGETAADPAAYAALSDDMKALSKIALALGQTNESLKICINDLTAWSDAALARVKELLVSITLRLAALGVTIGAAYGLSALANKATHRYVHDPRRREHLRLARKIGFTGAVVLILFFGFFTDLSSLATFAGLLTAGVAFASKDMILSLFAYFQFFGASQIRLGDDITVAGVTGKVMHVGVLRFTMAETEKADTGYLPTGRMVGFANSVLFNTTPLFRQMPGTNFVWSQTEILVHPTADHAAAYARLSEIAKKTYAPLKDGIRRNEAAMLKISPFKIEVSEPQMYYKFTNVGIAFTIRCAVERDKAREFHLRLTEEILAAARKDPELKVLHVV